MLTTIAGMKIGMYFATGLFAIGTIMIGYYVRFR
jgi:hypothetical protein